MSPVEPVYNHGPEHVQDEPVLGKEDRQETVHLRDVHVSLDITFFQCQKCLNFVKHLGFSDFFFITYKLTEKGLHKKFYILNLH